MDDGTRRRRRDRSAAPRTLSLYVPKQARAIHEPSVEADAQVWEGAGALELVVIDESRLLFCNFLPACATQAYLHRREMRKPSYIGCAQPITDMSVLKVGER